MSNELKIFTGTANTALANEICEYLRVELGQSSVTRFSDGEIYFQILENVRGVLRPHGRLIFVLRYKDNFVTSLIDGVGIPMSCAMLKVASAIGLIHSRWQMKRHGYRLIRRLGHNGWYVPAGENILVSSSDRWEILRKYYLALPFRMVRNAFRRVRRLYADWWAGR